MEVRELTLERLEDLFSFFETTAFADNRDWSDCYCFFPYHDPADGPFSDRSAAENRAAMEAAVRDGRAGGFLAYQDGRVVGWCNAAPRSAFPSLASLPGDGSVIGATPCFVVDPRSRGRGVARALLAAATEALAATGIQAMESAPDRRAEGEAANFRGPVRLYEGAGYVAVAELPDGTVLMRKKLDRAGLR